MKQVSSDLTGIALTVQSIKNGEVVIFPTDTVYGIGCNPYDENAVDRVYRLKKRNRTKPSHPRMNSGHPTRQPQR